jgi:hypothetical protein
MKIFLSVSFFFLIISTNANAQCYYGKFRHQPHLNEFNHLVITQNPDQAKSNGVMRVEAIANSGELWQSRAEPTKKERSMLLINRFETEFEIKSVHTLTIPHPAEKWKYYLLGYKDAAKKYNYIVVEGLQDSLDDRELVDIYTSDTNQITAKK